MTRNTPLSDILAILLIQSDYDPDTTLKQAILNVEKYEKSYNRYFATYQGEFRFMFYYLALLRGLITFDDIYGSSGKANDSYYNLEYFENITIMDWIGILLEYEVYKSNDSDQMWWKRGEEGWFYVNGQHYLLDEKNQNNEVFYSGDDVSQEEGYRINDFVREHLGSTERIRESALFDCKVRRFFEVPENINRDKIADFFKENLKMDILTAWSHSLFQLPSPYQNLRDFPNYILSSLLNIPTKTDFYRPSPERISDKVVFFLVDGMGTNLFWKFDQHPFLKYFPQSGVKNSIQCQFPSTTVSNVTTIHAGQGVAQHGMFDWQYYEPQVDDIITPVKFSYARDNHEETLKNRADPQDILPLETFYQKLAGYGIKSTVFQNSEYNSSTYSQTVLKGADVRGYSDLEGGLNDLAQCIDEDQGKHYYLFYYDRIDQLSHEYGFRSPEVQNEVNYLLDQIYKFTRSYPPEGEILFILSSDHGQMEDAGKNIYLNLEVPEIEGFIESSGDGQLRAPAGSPRAMSLHIKEDCLDDAWNLLREKLLDKAVVYKTSDLLEDSEFSRANSPYRDIIISEKLMGRLGNLLILPVESWTVWWYEEGVHELKNKGHHGGLSYDEMNVPFLVWR